MQLKREDRYRMRLKHWQGSDSPRCITYKKDWKLYSGCGGKLLMGFKQENDNLLYYENIYYENQLLF